MEKCFGQIITLYEVYPEVQKVLDEELRPVYDIWRLLADY